MSEQPDHGQQEAVDHEPTGSSVPEVDESVELTGHPVVDDVLRTLQGLQSRPVEEHVAVFESAHEKLRQALANADEQPNRPSGS